ncbi:hypothetical protein [uncultured Bacteroides sp.]|uniref:hypothetical protein n=1 Tax=uncultured Bacteroides sp. TaxID=162156 RepID=UPI00260CA632|nr:hypothetical protein [uncultured Bacteroides sp.]
MKHLWNCKMFALYGWLLCCLLGCLCGCTDQDENRFGTDFRKALIIQGNIEQECISRADDGGFADGDRMGIFVVDYNGNTPGTLQNSGNRATNFALTYNVATGMWKGNTNVSSMNLE